MTFQTFTGLDIITDDEDFNHSLGQNSKRLQEMKKMLQVIRRKLYLLSECCCS